MRIVFTYFFLFFFAVIIQAQQFFPVKIDNQWGLIDARGKVVLEPQYEAIG